MERQRSRSDRLRGVEGIRAIAATSVVLYHVAHYAAPDEQPVDLGLLTKVFENLRAGVTLFFVLSGFLLYRVFVGAALRGRPMPSVREYLRNRALRILPAYWAVLIGVVLVFQHELLTAPLELVANFFLVQNYVPAYVAGGEEGLGIVPAWSIVVEVSFYVLLPALGYFAVRRAAGSSHVVLAALLPVLGMFGAGIASKAIARQIEPSGALTVLNATIPTHADWFAAGMAVAVARVLYEDGRLRFRPAWVAVTLASTATLAAVAAKLYYDGRVSGLEQQTPNAIFFAVGLAAIVLAPSDAPVVRWLSARPIHFVGLASYSLFLVHDPLLRGLRDWGLTRAGASGFVFNVLVIGGISLLLAILAYLYVERPALARKRSWHVGDQAGLGSDAVPGDEPGEQVTLADALAQAVRRLRGAPPGGIAIDYGSDGAGQALVRPDVVVPVVAPLVENAVAYGRTGVRVVARAASGGVAVSVEDRGRGVDREFVPRLFEAHARSERSSHEAHGSGLGLARARALARRNGGDVRYEPRDGGGARFTAVLPRDSARRPGHGDWSLEPAHEPERRRAR